MSDVVKREVYKLLDEELEAANNKFPMFNSNHEAFAVFLEEMEEARDEAQNLEIISNNIWISTKENHAPEVLHEQYTAAYEAAINLAVEAIQTAAMARKAILSNVDMMMIDKGEI